MSTNNEQNAAHNAAREHAWEWFKFHAAQRMTVFNFFLIITAALTTGYLTSFVGKNYLISATLSVLKVLVVVSFFCLDARNRYLINLGEEYLRFEEGRLANIVGQNSIKFIEKSDLKEKSGKPKKIFFTFRLIMRAVFFIFGVIALLGFYFALYLHSAATTPGSGDAGTAGTKSIEAPSQN